VNDPPWRIDIRYRRSGIHFDGQVCQLTKTLCVGNQNTAKMQVCFALTLQNCRQAEWPQGRIAIMTTRLTLNIIGCGKLGKTLGRLWTDKGFFTVQDVLNRDAEHGAAAIAFMGAGRAIQSYRDLRAADVTLIGAIDDQIGDCCERLTESGVLGPTSIVFHCSGALPGSILEPAAKHGSSIASAHPVASFAEPAQMIGRFTGIWCAMEGDPVAVALLKDAFTSIGAVPVEIDGQAKTLYHAAAVFASNYVITLLDVAANLYEHAGIDRTTAYAMMRPLVEGSTDNVFRLGTAQALTGPVARGDAATVIRQHAALDALDAPLGTLYRQLAGFTARLAKQPDALAKQSPADAPED